MTDTTRRSGIRSTLLYAGVLGGFTTLAAALLVAGNLATRDAIAQRAQDDLLASLGQVVPASVHDNDLLKDTVTVRAADGTTLTVYRARRDGQVRAVAFRTEGQGYGGAISLVMGVDRDGKLLGVRVLAHSETPGLGDRIEPAKDRWITRFSGRSLDDPAPAQWGVKKDGGVFDQFSGATITPRAVVKAIKEGLLLFQSRRQELLDDAGNKVAKP